MLMENEVKEAPYNPFMNPVSQVHFEIDSEQYFFFSQIGLDGCSKNTYLGNWYQLISSNDAFMALNLTGFDCMFTLRIHRLPNR